nr:alpha-galactosidase [uncultured Vibrio sp.]
MSIKYYDKHRMFHIQCGDMSYVLGVNKYDFLQHIYWGEVISLCEENSRLLIGGTLYDGASPRPQNIVSLNECTRQEFPFYGTGDYKSPAFSTKSPQGHTTNELKYVSHRIVKGKPSLEGLPATYMDSSEEGETLFITLRDSHIGLDVILSYTCYHDRNVIVRSAKFLNISDGVLSLEKALSMSVDMEDHHFDFMELWGSWGNERSVDRQPLSRGKSVLESKRGSSSHQKNPFVALMRKNANEDTGDVYGFSLVYSGNFIAEIEVEQFDYTRVNMGINPYGFSWELAPNSEFQTPEVVMVYSSEGLGGMSRTFHSLYKQRLCRGQYRDMSRPVVINNWEATYFDYDSKKLFEIAHEAKKFGVELFVLDDGWFGRRNNDSCSLGDWQVNLNKIPEGLDGFAQKLHAINMKFGLWVEPEMVSKNSELYRLHPDWCIHIPGREPVEVRNQLVLDLSRNDVCEYIINSVSGLLDSGLVEYVKWDFNRDLMDIGNEILPAHRQKELGHRYILGLYRIYETLITRFPSVLFEGCASGGGRFDPGILHYMPQIWASDNTDPIARLSIQHGTSLVYPMSTMGAHVSASPNHQTGRYTSIETRGNVALSGCFGFELDPRDLTSDEKEAAQRQVQQHKLIQDKIACADLYRIHDPAGGEKCAWIFVSNDKRWACVFYIKMLAKTVRFSFERLKLKGLQGEMVYTVQGSNERYTGSELMKIGLDCSNITNDFDSDMWILTAN